MQIELLIESDSDHSAHKLIDDYDYIINELCNESILIALGADAESGIVQVITESQPGQPVGMGNSLREPLHKLEEGAFVRDNFGYAGVIGRLTVRLTAEQAVPAATPE